MITTDRRAREVGQTMTEYAVILAVITPAIVLAFAALSGKAGELIGSIIEHF